ncbi:MAG TPA: FRG domain-containing protein [Sphingomicrobium sp.]|nr:FRG domain-containing protein [Sphingomicrobium sp.]
MDPTNVQQFLDRVAALAPRSGQVIVYRGHEDREFYLVPAVFRDGFEEKEHLLLSELISAHPTEFRDDTTALERLVRVQHYDLPTRLLDVSWNPLVALYFATAPRKGRRPAPAGSRTKTETFEKDGQVVVFRVDEGLVKYYDSDTVSCLSNLSRLKSQYKEELKRAIHTSPEIYEETSMKRLMHFIRSEKPAFLEEIVLSELEGVFLVKPKQNNRRITAQSGAFFIIGLTEKVPEGGMYGISIERITIPGRHKAEIREQLTQLAINEKSMFPELDRAARYIKGSMTPAAILSKSGATI